MRPGSSGLRRAVMAPGTSYPLPAQHPFGGMDAWRLLSLRATASPEAPFLTWHPFEGDARTWTYGAFARDALAVAAGLRQRGVRAGDRVLIHLENCPEFLLAWFGCAALGAVAVTTNARSAADELRYYASDSEPVGAITQPRFAGLVAAAAPRLSWRSSLDKVNKAALRTFLTSGDPLEQAERNWLAEAAADPSGDAP